MIKKITIYTISSCPFSQQEKDYLKDNNFPFEEKNLEQNREWLTEMLTVSNNFAGAPVTKIEDENGQITILKGFTKEEFDKVLGLVPVESQPAVAVTQAGIKIPPLPPSSSPAPSISSSTNQASNVPNSPIPPVSVSSSSSDPSLRSVLENLEQKTGDSTANQSVDDQPNSSTQVPKSSLTSTDLPNIPDFPS